MTSFASTLYRGLCPAIAALAPLLGRTSAKWRRGLNGRNGLMDRLINAADIVSGGIWFHATSVGEYEQARPVIASLREQGHGPIAVTLYSPSGLDFARVNPAGDFHDYLPFDTPANMTALFNAWRPRCLVFAKYDSWPNQVAAATAAGVPVIMISGALPENSGRLHRLVRPLFRDVYNQFACIGTGSTADQQRFIENLGVTAPTRVTGDTRAEQVIQRFERDRNGDVATALQQWGEQRLVLGSTWPPDEQIWWDALPQLLHKFPGLNVVLVPHEPTTSRVRNLIQKSQDCRIPATTLTDYQDHNDPARILVVDRVGVLAEIYGVASIAYVGGGFTTGVHSTLEPAVPALPILFGPRISNAEEALTMVSNGGGKVVQSGRDILNVVPGWLEEPDTAARAGRSARLTVDTQIGATDRSAAMIVDIINQRR